MIVPFLSLWGKLLFFFSWKIIITSFHCLVFPVPNASSSATIQLDLSSFPQGKAGQVAYQLCVFLGHIPREMAAGPSAWVTRWLNACFALDFPFLSALGFLCFFLALESLVPRSLSSLFLCSFSYLGRPYPPELALS